MKNIDTQQLDSPLGPMILAATAQGLCGVWFVGQRHGPTEERMRNWAPQTSHDLLQETARQLRAYFAGELRAFDLPLDLSKGTPFQQSVWRALLHITHGKNQSYGDLARDLSNPKAVRAVGAAVGRNPLSIIVPCHRILGAGGQLTGYAGGLWRKQALLSLEGHPLAAAPSEPLLPE